MRFNTYLKSSVPKIDKALFEILMRWQKEVNKINPTLSPLVEEFIKSCKGGKRLRGTLVLLGYELAGGKVNNDICKIAAAHELFHTAILAHDDVIDQSHFRRGRPSLHKAIGGNHYGISQAISLGDAGFFLALKVIAESSFPDDKKNRALQIFIASMLDTSIGEMLDVSLPNKKDDNKEVDVLAIAGLKTARYSFSEPLMVGAVLASANKKQLLLQLKKFGENIGIAFQIQDDILGIFGDEKEAGKSVRSDISEGKITFLFIHAKENADKNQRMILSRYYGKKNFIGAEAERIKNIFIQTGALKHTQEKVLHYSNKAIAILPTFAVENDANKALRNLPDFLIGRKK